MLVTMEHDELVEAAKLPTSMGAKCRITGYWLWAQFDGKPSDEEREQLKTAGFIWCAKKREWALRGAISTCPKRKNMGWSYIVTRYGEEEVTV